VCLSPVLCIPKAAVELRLLPARSLQPWVSSVPRVLPEGFGVILKTSLLLALHQPFAGIHHGRCAQTLSPIAAKSCPFSQCYRNADWPGEIGPSCLEASFKLVELGSWRSLRSEVPGLSLVLVNRGHLGTSTSSWSASSWLRALHASSFFLPGCG